MKNILILLILLISITSLGQYNNWSAVKIGNSDMSRIYVGSNLVWENAPVIDEETYINFIVESSSLGQTQDSIEIMVNTVLKDELVIFYGSELLYNQRVTVSSASTERIFSLDYLNKDVSTITSENGNKVVNFVYEDEVDNAYYEGTFNPNAFDPVYGVRYTDDITALKASTLAWASTSRYNGVVFYVDNGFYDLDSFLDAIYTGLGVYSGIYGLEDRTNQFRFYYSATEKLAPNQNRDYYYQRTIQALRDLGFDI